jgi:hypothetical protein
MRNSLAIRRNLACTQLHAWFTRKPRRGSTSYQNHSSMNLPLPCQRRWCNIPEDSTVDIREWILGTEEAPADAPSPLHDPA